MTVMNVNLTNTALVGSLLAPTPWLITLPISIQFVAVMLATIPASLMMAQFGRKPIFLIGVFMVTIGAFGQASSILIENFELLVFFFLFARFMSGCCSVLSLRSSRFC